MGVPNLYWFNAFYISQHVGNEIVFQCFFTLPFQFRKQSECHFKHIQLLMPLVSIDEAPNGRVDGRSLLLGHTEKEMVVITDGRHLKGDENSRASSMTFMSFMPKP